VHDDGALPDGPGAVVMHVDITDRKRAEFRLQRSEEQFREISHAIPVPFALIRHQDGSIVFANQRFEALYGGDPATGENDSLPPAAYTGPVDREVLLHHLAAGGGRVAGLELEGRDRHGERKMLSVTASVLEFRREKMIVAVFLDITEQKRMETALKEQEHQLRQRHKVEALGTLAGGIAHDFNNLLQPITMLVEYALAELPADSAIRDDLKDVLDAARRATELVAQILRFARAEEPPRSPHDLAQQVRESLHIARQTLPATIHGPKSIAEVGQVICTPSDIQQIFLNLVTNARDAMHGKGHITVILTHANIDQFMGERGQRLPPGRYAHLTVSDTGQGMEPTTMERIFDPFFTTKAVGAGTGMGLSAVQGIVEACAGDVFVDSQPGEGTTFHILLPLTEGGD
jgi:PAS domain S-box-containing protein